MTGRFIAFEGGEGSGKSTQAERLARRLGAVLTREPGGTPTGARMRAILLDPVAAELDARAEALLMVADRAQHVAEVVRPALARGQDVVTDRSAHSSLAYQGFGRGLDLETLRHLSDWASQGVWPDLVVLLDLPPEAAAERLARELDRFEQAGSQFHGRVVDGFRAMAAADPSRWVLVDGRGDVEEVATRVTAAFDTWASER